MALFIPMILITYLDRSNRSRAINWADRDFLGQIEIYSSGFDLKCVNTCLNIGIARRMRLPFSPTHLHEEETSLLRSLLLASMHFPRTYRKALGYYTHGHQYPDRSLVERFIGLSRRMSGRMSRRGEADIRSGKGLT
jgi:hypothetical protein